MLRIQYFLQPGCLALMVAGFSCIQARAQTTLLSSGVGGAPSNGTSVEPRASGDGRYIVFASDAANLIPGGSNGLRQIFRVDRVTGTTQLVSSTSSGVQANGPCRTPDVSDDGRYVAFASLASNLGAFGGPEYFIFVKDMVAGTLQNASVSNSGAVSERTCEMPEISADGRFVTFLTTAGNLVPGDTGDLKDAFLRDRLSATTTRVSTGPGGEQANADTLSCDLARNGGFVAFHTLATNLLAGGTCNQVFVKDMSSGALERASVDSNGTPAAGCSWYPALSADARYVAFASSASNLVAGDTNGREDIFVRDRLSGTTIRASVSTSGTQSNNYCGVPSISNDGRIVSFDSPANNLVAGSFPSNRSYLYVRNLDTSETVMASLSSSGGAPNSDSADGARGHCMIGNGTEVAFASFAGNLVIGDNNGFHDAFVRLLFWTCTAPQITQHPAPATLCAGDSVTFTAASNGSPAPTYQWRRNGAPISGATAASLTLPSIAAGDAGQYTLAATNFCGTAISDAATLIVGLAITTQPQAAVICDGSYSAYLLTQAQGVGPVTYQWRRDGIDIPGETGTTLQLSPWVESDSATYSCLVQSSCGNQLSQDAVVTVQPPITFTMQPQPQTVCLGDSATFTTAVNSPPPYTNMYWRINNTDIPTTSFSLTVNNVTVADVGPYQLFVVNSCGLAASDSVFLTIHDAPSILQQPSAATRCLDESVTFTVWAADEGEMAYQWRHNGADIDGANDHFYSIPVVGAGHAGDYDVVITGNCGTTISSAASLSVNSGCTGSPAVYHVVEMWSQFPNDRTFANGVNRAGTVVGENWPGSASGNFLGAAWRSNGQPLTGVNVRGRDINDQDQVAGYTLVYGGHPRAAYGPIVGPPVDLQAMIDPEPFSSSAQAINAAGEVIFGTSSNAGQLPAYFFDGSSLLTIAQPGMSGFAEPIDLNDSGRMVGTWSDGSQTAAVLWIDHVPTFLTSLSGDTMTTAGAISPSGVVVGTSGTSSSAYSAVRWDAGAPAALGILPDQIRATAADVNSENLIVGTREIAGDLRATLWQGTAASDLTSMIEPGAGWTLRMANAINELGWIAGDGINPAGSIRGYLLIPYHRIEEYSGNQTRPQGDSVTFHVDVVGAGGLSYQWFRDGVPLSNGGGITGANSATLTIAAVQGSDAAQYRARITRGPASVESPPMSLSISGCYADLSGDGAVGLDDLTRVLSSFGTTAGATYEQGDLDRDGDVDLVDLTLLLSRFGVVCP